MGRLSGAAALTPGRTRTKSNGEVELVNLLLFTIEVERDPGAAHGAWRGVGVGARPTPGLAWVALAIVGLVCAGGAAFGGWLIARRDPTAAGRPDCLGQR